MRHAECGVRSVPIRRRFRRRLAMAWQVGETGHFGETSPSVPFAAAPIRAFPRRLPKRQGEAVPTVNRLSRVTGVF